MPFDPIIRLGIIGAGRWGRVCLRTVLAMTRANLAAIASTNPETAHIVPDNCQLFSDWRELIQHAELEGLIIATPPATHALISMMAMEASLPVFVEKPLTLSAAEAKQLRKVAAKQKTRIFFTDHIHLFSSAFRRLKELVANAGKIICIESFAGNYGPYRQDTSMLWDWGAHDVAMMLDLFGTFPDEIASELLDRHQIDGNLGETIQLRLTFGEIITKITISTLCEKKRVFIVRCEQGIIIYDDLAPNKLSYNGITIPINSTLPLTVAIHEFVSAIDKGNIDLAGLELGISVVEVLEKAGYELSYSVS